MKNYRCEIALLHPESRHEVSFEETFTEQYEAQNRMYEFREKYPDYIAQWTEIVTVIDCHCGRKVDCYDFTNTCKCGADYNFNGDLLTDRECWGEETGEHWTECY